MSLHKKVKENNEEMTRQYEEYVSQGRRELIFNSGDLVWMYLRKDISN